MPWLFFVSVLPKQVLVVPSRPSVVCESLSPAQDGSLISGLIILPARAPLLHAFANVNCRKVCSPTPSHPSVPSVTAYDGRGSTTCAPACQLRTVKRPTRKTMHWALSWRWSHPFWSASCAPKGAPIRVSSAAL